MRAGLFWTAADKITASFCDTDWPNAPMEKIPTKQSAMTCFILISWFGRRRWLCFSQLVALHLYRILHPYGYMNGTLIR